MKDTFCREIALIGEEKFNKILNSHVAVFGIGGVGGYVVEMLARAGVGKLDLFDKDVVEKSNINRQIIALNSTINQYKTEVMAKRVVDINPNIKVTAHNVFYLPENADNYPLQNYTYIVDAIDNVTAKIELIKRAKQQNVPIICAMGSGCKLNTDFIVEDISNTTDCSLARVMRKELRKNNINNVTVVYSKEKNITTNNNVLSSICYVPCAMAIKMCEKVIKDIIL